MRKVTDIKELRKKIFDFVLDAVISLPPVSLQNREIRLENIRYSVPKNKDLYSLFNEKDEASAVFNNGSLLVNLVGDAVLYEDGKPIGSKRVIIAKVPYLTDRGVFIINGVNIALANQLRLKPGIYPRITTVGTVSAMVNPEVGQNFNIEYDPDHHIFTFKLKRGSFPLYGLLKYAGVSDDVLASVWGKDILEINKKAFGDKNISRFLSLIKAEGETEKDKIINFFSSLQLDPNVVSLVLGKPSTNLSLESVIDISQKLLNIAQGKEEEVYRDNLPFQRVITPARLFYESIKFANIDYRKAFFKALMKKDPKFIRSNIFTKALDATFRVTSLGQVLQDINSAERLDQIYRITKMGRGSIENVEGVALESRNVQPTYLGYIDPLQTPENEKVGVDMRLTNNVFVDDNTGMLYREFINLKTGKRELLSSFDVYNKKVIFPGEKEYSTSGFYRGIYRGRLGYFKADEAEYALPDMNDQFSIISGSIPFISNSFPQRISMGSRMKTQALPLVNREVPLVTAKYSDGSSFEMLADELRGIKKSPVNGTVVSLTDTEMVIKGDDGKKYTVTYAKLIPNNNKTGFYHIPIKKVNDRVKAGEILFTTNFSDKNGEEALGINARIAFLPYYLLDIDDAFVISESFAKKLTSEHFYQKDFNLEDNLIISKNRYNLAFPSKFSREALDKVDENGIVKKGAILKEGDPIILAFVPPASTKARIDKLARATTLDKSLVWDHSSEGEVIEVVRGKDFIKIVIKTKEETKVGDKLSGRFGDKGVISAIIPDHLMPRDEEGKPFDILMSTISLVSRGNVSQLYEAALGKVALKAGQRYLVDHWSYEPTYNFIINEMKKHNVKSKENVYDPISNKVIKDVFTGVKYIMKLHITSESKVKGRAVGEYTLERVPAKGGEDAARFFGLLDINAILAHGAYKVLHDTKILRGQRQENFWRHVLSGYSPLIEEKSFVYEKFLNLLKAAGINPYNKNEQIHLLALTNKDINLLAQNRVIENTETVDWNTEDFKPISGGLFDISKTGGHNGKLWSKIELDITLPSPVVEEVLRTILDVNEQEFENIIAGKVNIKGTSLTGPQGLYKYFAENYDINKDIKDTIKIIEDPNTTLNKLDKSVKKLKYLYSIKLFNQNIKDWFWNAVPVIPPAFRPVAVLPNSDVKVIDDLNYLYSRVFEANQVLRQFKQEGLDTSNETLSLYKSLKSLVGLIDPIGKFEKAQQINGILKVLFGKTGKLGYFQKKVLGTAVDYSGQAVIIPDANLSIDEIGIPEELAWSAYKMFILKNLKYNFGIRNLQEALKHYENRTELARKALLEEMKRPVIIKRDPLLHRYGFMAFKPVLVKGNVIHLNPIHNKLFGADFDGNCVSGDTEIFIKLFKNALNLTEEGREFYKKFMKLEKSYYKNAIYKIKIKDLPLSNNYKIDKNGAKVYSLPYGITTYSYSEISNFFGWERVTKLTVEEQKEVCKVTFEDGRYLHVSTNESLLVFNDNEQLIKVKPSEALGKYCLSVDSNLLFSTVYPKKVKIIDVKIENKDIMVYDLVVPSTKNFVTGNGIVVADTMAFHILLSDEAIKEAEEKMLPSKNIFYTKTFKLTHKPEAEILYGLWEAGTTDPNNSNVLRISSIEELKKKLNEGSINLKDNVILTRT